MNNSRRSFIKQGGIAVAGTLILPSSIFAGSITADHIVGLQLYTVRDEMKKDPTGTLQQVAKAGYKYVEHASYHDRKFYNYSISDFKKLLNDNGLTMLSGHHFFGSKQWDKSKNDFTDEWKNTITDAAEVGMKYVISPGVDESLCANESDYKNYMEWMNKCGKLCKASGVTFGFHNESYEFAHKLGDKVLYDILLRSTDPHLVAQQIDIGNMYEPGGNALKYVKENPGRFISMHVKNEIKKTAATAGEQYESTILDKGVLNVKEIVDLAAKSGTLQFIVEQESYQGRSPMECSVENLRIMKGWGY